MGKSLTAVRGEGAWMKGGEGISQGTHMHDPQAQTALWGQPEVGWGRG